MAKWFTCTESDFTRFGSSSGFWVSSAACTATPALVSASVTALLPRIQNYGPTPESMFNTLPDLTSAQKKRLQQADAP